MRLILVVLLFALSTPLFAECKAALLDKNLRRLGGSEENLCARYGGKVVLVVNTASKCGYTPQYKGLEALYKANQGRGLVVLGFPSDQFLGQEYSSDGEIQKFCQVNYGVTFPMFSKSDVRGTDANPLFRELSAATGESPSWNFNKYLIGRDGHVVAHYDSSVAPDAAVLRTAIDAELAKPAP